MTVVCRPGHEAQQTEREHPPLPGPDSWPPDGGTAPIPTNQVTAADSPDQPDGTAPVPTSR